MKKCYSLAFFLLLIVSAKAQYNKLIDFNGTNGTSPYGSVILSDGDSILYGMTNGGGTTGENNGTIFSMRTDGTSYTNLHNFSTTDTSGANPYGSLIRSGNVLYGMTSRNGLYDKGTIFSINTDGSGFTTLYHFRNDSINDYGANPYGTLTRIGSKLYGMTDGDGGHGNIFSIHMDGSNYQDLHVFSGMDGSHPGYGALAETGNMLFGTTIYGGLHGSGVFFSIDTGGLYTKLRDFNAADGTMPLGSVTMDGGTFYGTASSGGAYGKGTLFSTTGTDTGSFTKLMDFNGTNGQGPIGSLTSHSGKLFGTTAGGGTNNYGTVFSMNTNGSGFQTLFNFGVSTNGTQPRAQVSLSGTMLYGTTVIGGNLGHGVVYSLDTDQNSVPLCMVTVNDSSDYNYITWDKPVTTDIDSFIVYRETTSNNYERVASLPYSAAAEFIDTVRALYFPFTGDPNAGSNRYRLQVRYTIGSYSLLSPLHRSIFMTRSGGTFTWNHYENHGEAIPLYAYMLYRDDNSTGAWHSVQAVSGTSSTVADPDFALYPNARWRVETVWGITCSSNPSISNVRSMLASGLSEEEMAANTSIYPNPAKDFIEIETELKDCLVSIYDNTGKLVFKETIRGKTRIGISDLTSGLYFMQLNSENTILREKFVKE